jgi:hypothetical protein
MNASGFQVFQAVFQDRPFADFQQAFRPIIGQRSKAAAASRTQDDRFHWVPFKPGFHAIF